MDRRRFGQGAMLPGLTAAFTLALACRPADTVVRVRVDGFVPCPFRQLAVEATIDREIRSFRLPEQPRDICLPTDFTLQIPRSWTGRVWVIVAALDGEGREIARAEGMLAEIEVGVESELRIILGVAPGDGGVRADGGGADAPPAVPGKDGGVDAAGAPDAAAADGPLEGGADAEGADGAVEGPAPTPDAGVDAAPDGEDAPEAGVDAGDAGGADQG